MSNSPFKGTTICAVRRNGQIAIAGDGQVTMGENTIFKTTARKVRRLYHGRVAVGFAGSVVDAFTLCEKFEEKLEQCSGNLEKAAVALAQSWRGDQTMRQLESMMIVADPEEEPNFLNGVLRYKKQYQIEKILPYDAPDLKEAVCEAETILIGELPDDARDGILRYFADPSIRESCIGAIRAEKQRLSWQEFCQQMLAFQGTKPQCL